MAKGKKNGKKVTTKKATKKPPVSVQVFIETWQKADSADAVAKKLGLTKQTVVNRANKYRKRGAKSLQKFASGPRGPHPLNPSELESLAKKFKSASA